MAFTERTDVVLAKIAKLEKLPLPAKVATAESDYWPAARDIFHFVGICGAGKTTLASRMAKRCKRFGGKAIGTLDYDPHTPDHERGDERAFSRELDRLNNEAGQADPAIHQQIVQHSLDLIERWKGSDANAVFVDRWYESYDGLPEACRGEIEAAIAASGFSLHHVLLLVEGGPDFAPPSPSRNAESIRQRLLQTKAHRPDAWWATGPASLDEWVREEVAYQESYRKFCKASRFPTILLNTREISWDYDEKLIVSDLLGIPPAACA